MQSSINLFKKPITYAVLLLSLLIVYLVLLNTVILYDLIENLTASYEYGFGIMLVLVPLTWVYTFLCISSIVLYALYLSLKKPVFILIGALLHLVFTLLYHIIVQSMTYSRSFAWGYLVIAAGFAAYFYFLKVRKTPTPNTFTLDQFE